MAGERPQVPQQIWVVLVKSEDVEGRPEWDLNYAAATKHEADQHEGDIMLHAEEGIPDPITLVVEYRRVR